MRTRSGGVDERHEAAGAVAVVGQVVADVAVQQPPAGRLRERDVGAFAALERDCVADLLLCAGDRVAVARDDPKGGAVQVDRVGELAGVVRVDTRQIGDGNIGPMTRRLSELFAARTAAEGYVIA